MTDQQKGVFFYYKIPLAMMFTAQLAVAMLLIFDRSITLLQGTILIALALFCVFLVSSPNSRVGSIIFKKYPEVDFDFLESNWPRMA